MPAFLTNVFKDVFWRMIPPSHMIGRDAEGCRILLRNMCACQGWFRDSLQPSATNCSSQQYSTTLTLCITPQFSATHGNRAASFYYPLHPFYPL